MSKTRVDVYRGTDGWWIGCAWIPSDEYAKRVAAGDGTFPVMDLLKPIDLLCLGLQSDDVIWAM